MFLIYSFGLALFFLSCFYCLLLIAVVAALVKYFNNYVTLL